PQRTAGPQPCSGACATASAQLFTKGSQTEASRHCRLEITALRRTEGYAVGATTEATPHMALASAGGRTIARSSRTDVHVIAAAAARSSGSAIADSTARGSDVQTRNSGNDPT